MKLKSISYINEFRNSIISSLNWTRHEKYGFNLSTLSTLVVVVLDKIFLLNNSIYLFRCCCCSCHFCCCRCFCCYSCSCWCFCCFCCFYWFYCFCYCYYCLCCSCCSCSWCYYCTPNERLFEFKNTCIFLPISPTCFPSRGYWLLGSNIFA